MKAIFFWKLVNWMSKFVIVIFAGLVLSLQDFNNFQMLFVFLLVASITIATSLKLTSVSCRKIKEHLLAGNYNRLFPRNDEGKPIVMARVVYPYNPT